MELIEIPGIPEQASAAQAGGRREKGKGSRTVPLQRVEAAHAIGGKGRKRREEKRLEVALVTCASFGVEQNVTDERGVGERRAWG